MEDSQQTLNGKYKALRSNYVLICGMENLTQKKKTLREVLGRSLPWWARGV